MQKLKAWLNIPSKKLLLAERAFAALCLVLALVQKDGSFIILLLIPALALGLAAIWLCDLQVNGFGMIFGVLLEYYSTQMEPLVALAMTAAAYVLFFASLTREGPEKRSRP